MCFYSWDGNAEFSASLFKPLVSHDPSEIMLTLVKKPVLIFVHLFEIETRLYTFEIETEIISLYCHFLLFWLFNASSLDKLCIFH